MSKKLGLFLFALTVALGSGFVNATTNSCEQTCLIKYKDCLSKPWLTQGYCSYRFETCLATCGF